MIDCCKGGVKTRVGGFGFRCCLALVVTALDVLSPVGKATARGRGAIAAPLGPPSLAPLPPLLPLAPSLLPLPLFALLPPLTPSPPPEVPPVAPLAAGTVVWPCVVTLQVLAASQLPLAIHLPNDLPVDPLGRETMVWFYAPPPPLPLLPSNVGDS